MAQIAPNPRQKTESTALPTLFFVMKQAKTSLLCEDMMPKKTKSLHEQSHEQSLIRIANHKDRKAFIGLFEYFAPRIKSYLMASGSITDDIAEDLTQDVMVTIWRKASLFDPAKAAASTWIFTIARNKRIDFLRRRAPILAGDDMDLLDQGTQSTPATDEIYAQYQQAQSMREAVAQLPAEQGDLIRKAFFQDKTHIEIAEQENLPLGTVKSRIRLALDKLRQSMHKSEKEYRIKKD